MQLLEENSKLLNRTREERFIYVDIRKKAKYRNIDFSLSPAQLLALVKCECFYCKRAPQKRKVKIHSKQKELEICFNGIDRVDSSRGYSFDNVVPACKQCNQAKNTLTTEEFKELITTIYHNYVLKDINQ